MTFFRVFVKRLGGMAITLVAMSILIFLLVELMPGDAAQRVLGQSATPEAVAALRDSMGLNDPIWVRYGRWVSGMLQGDMGTSLYMRGSPSPRYFGGGLEIL
jgi:ABC-type dipeptide/oligopeptide/nickel transport systems, permease components